MKTGKQTSNKKPDSVPDMNFTKGAGKDARKIAYQGKVDTKIGPNSKPMPKGGKGRGR